MPAGPSKADTIRAHWDSFENANPDASNERLFALTMEACNCDAADVAHALANHPRAKPA